MSVKSHVLYALRNADVRGYPFPHFFARNVFPEDFYWKMLKNLSPDEEYTQMGGYYPNRFFGPKDIPEGCAFMVSNEFMNEVMMIFYPWFKKLYGDKKISISMDLRTVRDKKGYAIGPHTDAAWKLVSMLFYLPQTYGHKDCGTSIFVPKIRGFKCLGGPHYDFDGFDEAWRAPYEPNTCFGFWKTESSFHGVYPVEDDFSRDVLLLNLYNDDLIPAKHDSISGESLPEEKYHGNVRPEDTQ